VADRRSHRVAAGSLNAFEYSNLAIETPLIALDGVVIASAQIPASIAPLAPSACP